jgi:hypothetical protein
MLNANSRAVVCVGMVDVPLYRGVEENERVCFFCLFCLEWVSIFPGVSAGSARKWMG